MHYLILTAHPNPNGFSHIVADIFAETKQSQGHTVQIVNLYDPHYTQDFLRLDLQNKVIDDSKKYMMQEMVAHADEIILCFPLWWFGMPAILKNRRDNTMTSGFAFRYGGNGLMPTPLLLGKHIRVLCTTGGPGWFYRTMGYVLIVLPFWIGLCQYVGLSLRGWTWICDLPKHRTRESRQHIYDKITKIATRQDR